MNFKPETHNKVMPSRKASLSLEHLLETEYLVEADAAKLINEKTLLRTDNDVALAFLRKRRVIHDLETIFWWKWYGNYYYKIAHIQKYIRRENAKTRRLMRDIMIND